jgi:phosphoribosyl 1,2-cyclic phosphodiesterase
MAHGCNTPCVEIGDERTGAALILDGGTGIMSAAPRATRVLLTHYHWDHVQGLPFYAPLSERGRSVEIWGPRFGGAGPESIEALFHKPFYPVALQQLASAPTFHTVGAAELEIGGFQIRTQTLNHPGGALAYRVRSPSGDLVYATDHEFGSAGHDEALARFVRGARALIVDAHFTPEELHGHRGWGHSSWDQGARFAEANGVGQVWLFHHKPGRTDDEVVRIEAAAAGLFAPTRAAREGASFEV